MYLANIRCKDCGCIPLSLLEVGGIEERIPEVLLELPELIKRESGFRVFGERIF
jgi:hypothetical protein